MVTWVARRQEQGGTRGKENEVEKKSRKGELRTPLQASEQVWTVQLLACVQLGSLGKQKLRLHRLLQGCRDGSSLIELQRMIVELLFGEL